MISARFYDGKSARSLEAQVRVLGQSLIVYELESKSEHSYPLKELEITKGSEIIISCQDVQIHLTQTNFQKLNIKQTFLGKEQKPILIGMLVASLIISVLYLTHERVIRYVAYLLPEEMFLNQVKNVTDIYGRMHCLTEVQNDHVKEIFGRLGKNYSDYKVFVIPDANPNAFAFPGNLIVVNDGLLKKITNPDALAGVIAHEIAHIEGKHVNIGFVKNFVIEALWSTWFDDGAISKIGKNMSQGLFSQGQEQEADQVAAEVLRDQGINPKGTAEFFKTLENEENTYLRYLMLSHPPYPDRVKTFSQVYDSTPVLSQKAWAQLKTGCSK